METRDRLKARADRFEYPSLDAYLIALVEAAEREEQLEKLSEQMARMTEQDWADYQAEMAVWDATLMDGLRDEPPYPQD